MQKSSNRIIATRELVYAPVGDSTRRSVRICINEPFRLTEGSVDFRFDEGTAGCIVSLDGLPKEEEMTVYGADTLQALSLAVGGVDKYLRRLSRNYTFYFDDTGEPYFDDRSEES